MFFGTISPEEAIAAAKELQRLRLTDPDAEIEVDVPPPPKPEIYLETVDGQTRSYGFGTDGAKVYLPPTSAALRGMVESQRMKDSVDALGQNLATLGHSSVNALVLAMILSPRAGSAILQLESLLSQTIIYADTLTPGVCSSETCIDPSVGNGALSNKGDLTVFSHVGYDYAPSVMWDGGKYKMWWCGDANVNGDRILYAESTNLTSWTIYSGDPHGFVFSPIGGSAFDGGLTCDPSVVKVGGTYYM
jgi:hypothetical protein